MLTQSQPVHSVYSVENTYIHTYIYTYIHTCGLCVLTTCGRCTHTRKPVLVWTYVGRAHTGVQHGICTACRMCPYICGMCSGRAWLCLPVCWQMLYAGTGPGALWVLGNCCSMVSAHPSSFHEKQNEASRCSQPVSFGLRGRHACLIRAKQCFWEVKVDHHRRVQTDWAAR